MGQMLALENIDHTVAYTSPGGQVFYLAGPLAPVAGAQDGLILQEIRGVEAPIKHFTSKGARQDGNTWNDATYDAAEVDMTLEESGVTAASLVKVRRAWQEALTPTKLGKLSWYTPDGGEWWMDVRKFKNTPDAIQHNRSKRQVITCTAVNNDAFWKSFDSVSSFGLTYEDATDEFDREDHTGLGTGWHQEYTGDANGGLCGTDGANMVWYPGTSTGTRSVMNLFTAETPTAPNHTVSFVYSNIQGFPLPWSAHNDLWGRCGLDGDGNWDGNGIRMRLAGQLVSIAVFVDGVIKHVWERPLLVAPLWGETWTLVCGTAANDRQYLVLRDGFPALTYTEPGTESYVDEDHLYTGNGMQATEAIFGISQTRPAAIRKHSFADNLEAGQSGHLAVTNRGDQDGWVRFLCYGPGTFTFGNGPDTEATIKFGPIADGQVVMITTLPRLRSIVDLSPSLPTQDLDIFQELMKDLISFATNNNVPPLLQQFESWFGILPPQGNLYSLLEGRFTVPIPPKPEGKPPQTSHISVTIEGASPTSRVVAALTPLKTWPE